MTLSEVLTAISPLVEKLATQERELAELKQRVAAIEAVPSLRYFGVWASGRTYERGAATARSCGRGVSHGFIHAPEQQFPKGNRAGGCYIIATHSEIYERPRSLYLTSTQFELIKNPVAPRDVFAVSFSAGWFLTPFRAAAAASSYIAQKILIGIAVTATLLVARALAADLEGGGPPPVPYSNWSGPYIGIGITARYNAVDANVTSASVGTPPTAIPLPSVSEGYTNPLMWWGAGPGAHQFIDNIAIGARIYGGWNVQVAPVYVVGVEVDFAYANESAVFHGSPYPVNLFFGSPFLPLGASPYDEFKVKTTWDGSARLRAGWLANPSMMLYLTGGLAWAHLEVTSTCSIDPIPGVVSNCAPGNYFSGTLGPAVITNSAVKLGWTVGAGIDMLLGSQWVARVQYRFSDFGYPSFDGFSPFSFTDTRACNGCASATSSPLTVSYELPLMQHNFEVGLAYKFGQ